MDEALNLARDPRGFVDRRKTEPRHMRHETLCMASSRNAVRRGFLDTAFRIFSILHTPVVTVAGFEVGSQTLAAVRGMLTVLGPDGTEICCGSFGRGSAGLSDAAVSNHQFDLSPVLDEPGLMNLHNYGRNALVINKTLPDGSEVTTDLLEEGESAILTGGERFYVASRKETTTFVVLQLAPAVATPGSGAEAEVQQPAAKRARMSNQDADGPSTSGRRDGTSNTCKEAPFGLFRVQGIPDAANRGCRKMIGMASAINGIAAFEPLRIIRCLKPPTGLRLADVVKGPIKWALVSNFEIDLGWLLSACPDLEQADRIVLVHGEKHPAILGLLQKDAAATGFGEKIKIHAPPLPIDFGTHHSKAFILQYGTGVRLVIHTANLIWTDNNCKTQGLWSQDFPMKAAGSPHTSKFEADLIDYVSALKLPAEDAEFVKALCRSHDFSAARARLIVSRPGYHRGNAAKRFGHMALRSALQQEEFDTAFSQSPVFAQFSSMGSLDIKWLQELQESLCAGKGSGQGGQQLGRGPLSAQGLQLIWPTVSEVQNSVEGWAAGRSIPGPAKNVDKPFLQPLYHRYSGAAAGRQRAMPHIKSYGRYKQVEGGTRLAWIMLASHNLSKAAWGALQKGGEQLMIRSYELGVLLLPSLEANYRAHPQCGFCCTDTQPIALPSRQSGDRAVEFWARESPSQMEAGIPGRILLPLPYTLPPQQYSPSDRPWTVDGVYEGLDNFGRTITDEFPPLYGNTQKD